MKRLSRRVACSNGICQTQSPSLRIYVKETVTGFAPHPPNSPYSGPNLRRGVPPVPRVLPSVGRGRTAPGYRPNGRPRGRGRRASGVDAPGEAPGRSRLRRPCAPRRHTPPSPACVAWCPCGSGQVDLRLLVMGRARPRYSGDLGKLRQSLMPKAWQTHRNAPHGGVDFYPLLAILGKLDGPR
jgi:hypothetical protein